MKLARYKIKFIILDYFLSFLCFCEILYGYLFRPLKSIPMKLRRKKICHFPAMHPVTKGLQLHNALYEIVSHESRICH